MRLPFGKYKGEDTGDVPLDYLKWLEEHIENRQDNSCLLLSIQHEIKRRDGDRPGIGRSVKPGEARRPGKVRFD